MKIGILTLPLHTNFGGVLQAYSLQTILERMGHEVIVLDKDRDVRLSLFRQSLSYIKYLCLKFIYGHNVSYKSPQRINQERSERERNIREFINNYIHTRVIREIDCSAFVGMDAVFVGSDQVWRPFYFTTQWETNIREAYLYSLKDPFVKRVAYAVSFGTNDWEYSKKETRECSSLLTKFDAVSVREDTAITLCEKMLRYEKVYQVLDPTFLLAKEDYVNLVEVNHTPQSQGNLMCYFIDMTLEKQQLLSRIVKERGLCPFYVNVQENDLTLSNIERTQPSIEQWLRGFIDAEFVITDSFHACVFSIIFNKPFVVIGNAKRGMARYMSLLSLFSLRSHLICSIEEYNPEFNYEIGKNVNDNLERLRSFSLDFIRQSLN